MGNRLLCIPLLARNLRHLRNLQCYNASVREYVLFLRLLAQEVYWQMGSVLDAGDFREWLLEAGNIPGLQRSW